MAADQRLAPFVRSPRRAGIITDFDGVLSEIVAEPDDASAVDGASQTLIALAKRFAVVAAVSGRPVSFLEAKLPRSIVMVGLYGLEVRRRGKRDDFAGGGAWREVVADTATHAKARGPEGMRVENKGLSLTLHYREQPELEREVVALAQAEAARSGLRARPAKMSVELHPPVSTDKGTAIQNLADGLDAVLYAGDDIGDIPAFDALDELEASGISTMRIAVGGDEAPVELLDRADLVLPGPTDFVRWCQGLIARVDADGA